MGDKGDELVLCVDAGSVRRLFAERADGPWLPAVRIADDLGPWLARDAEWRRRRRVEDDPSVRHFSTYCMLEWSGEIFSYRRGRSGSEGRLHGLRSIGVGGHVTLDDYCGAMNESMLFAATSREVREEVECSAGLFIVDAKFRGLIADESDPVGRVHLGFVTTWCISPGAISPREDCLEDPRWGSPVGLLACAEPFERWSYIALSRLLSGPPEARP